MMTMMMTMTTSSEIELAGEEQLELQLDLQLGDEHVDASPIDTPENPLTSSEPISLPAALCDDKLLEEINSIPDKMGFKIGDVADMLGIKQYVLRYWETEFDLLKPKKASNNQRMYTRKDVENAFLIRKLLHRDRFSIEGARNALKELKAHVKKEKDYSQVVHRLDNLHDRLEDLVLDIRKARQLFK
jgi:DNA-binding transcriptional MerR regulator